MGIGEKWLSSLGNLDDHPEDEFVSNLKYLFRQIDGKVHELESKIEELEGRLDDLERASRK